MHGLHTSHLFVLALVAYSSNIFCEGYVKHQQFLPTGQFHHTLSIHENLDAKDFTFWIKDGEEDVVKGLSFDVSLNKGDKSEIVQHRIVLMTPEGAELEVFTTYTSSHPQNKGFHVKRTKIDNVKTKYEVTFKQFNIYFDKNHVPVVNDQRIYEVEKIDNPVRPVFSIKKETKKRYIVFMKSSHIELDNIKIESENVFISGYTEDGTFFDASIYEKYTTGYRLGCYKCFVYCQAEKDTFIADIIVEGSLLESLKVTSCDINVLKDSIYLEDANQCNEEPDPVKHISIVYLTDKGSCVRGKYDYRQRHTRDVVLKMITIDRQREDLKDNDKNCIKMKANERVHLYQQSKLHIGRISSKRLKVDTFLDGPITLKCSSRADEFLKAAGLAALTQLDKTQQEPEA